MRNIYHRKKGWSDGGDEAHKGNVNPNKSKTHGESRITKRELDFNKPSK